MTTRSVAPPARVGRTVLVLAALFAALEGFDLASYGVTVPSLLQDPSMGADKGSAGTVSSLVAVGMLVGAARRGAALSAALIRRLGSRRLLFGGAAVFSLGMLVCGVASPLTVLGGARFVVGVGLGVVLPTVTAYVADLSAPERRSRNVGITMAGYAAGALMAPLLGAALLPETSWRWIYLRGAVPAALLLPLAWRRLPESPVTLTAAGAAQRAGGDLFGLRALFAPGVWLPTLLFWVLSFCGLLLVFSISTWLPDNHADGRGRPAGDDPHRVPRSLTDARPAGLPSPRGKHPGRALTGRPGPLLSRIPPPAEDEHACARGCWCTAELPHGRGRSAARPRPRLRDGPDHVGRRGG
jgi:MFS family permease